MTRLPLERAVDVLRAAGEPTRLRLLALLSAADLTVTDLIDILGQSQPRISRHLRLLVEGGLVERHQEGAWAYFRTAEEGAAASLVETMLAGLDTADAQLERDRERLDAVRRRRAEKAAGYFARHAQDWDTLRSLHVEEAKVEAAMLELAGAAPFQAMLDLGTGTGRLLELFAPLYVRAVGVDMSRDMLAVARANLDEAGLTRVQIRQGDIFLLPTPAGHFDFVTLHQVLHYLEDPAAAIREAARALAPGGRLLIADFAPHELEFLREEHNHLRLGFSHAQLAEWLEAAGLEVDRMVDLEPESAGGEQKLTVTLCLARDPRMLVAGTRSTTES
ncbi:MAG: metalloregulator ArsR/SmtB family transcription factor [Pseudomonadota bacterium]|nr:metalloregulator ArsR/SmtB family transcription factor [Pseudomonadota bacterium]